MVLSANCAAYRRPDSNLRWTQDAGRLTGFRPMSLVIA
jgi:hypothetical protein